MTLSPQETPIPAAASLRDGDRPAAAVVQGATAPAGSRVVFEEPDRVEVGDLIQAGMATREVVGFTEDGRVVLGDPVNRQADGGLF